MGVHHSSRSTKVAATSRVYRQHITYYIQSGSTEYCDQSTTSTSTKSKDNCFKLCTRLYISYISCISYIRIYTVLIQQMCVQSCTSTIHTLLVVGDVWCTVLYYCYSAAATLVLLVHTAMESVKCVRKNNLSSVFNLKNRNIYFLMFIPGPFPARTITISNYFLRLSSAFRKASPFKASGSYWANILSQKV